MYPGFSIFIAKAIQMHGTKIRVIRELRGYSQAYLAEKLGIAQNSYSRIESNQTKLDTAMLAKIAAELGVSPAELLNTEPTVINFAPNQGTQGSVTLSTSIATRRSFSRRCWLRRTRRSRLLKIIEDLVARRG